MNMAEPRIVLYHCMSARSFRPLWALEELGLDYTLTMLPFPPRAHVREYLTVNLLGTVPALVVGDALMTESAAMCEWLAQRYGAGTLGVSADEADFAHYLNWLHYGEATLTFPQTLVLRYGRFEPPERRQPQVAEDYTRWFIARTKRAAEALASRPFLCANRFTAADISVGYALMLADHIGLIQELRPELQAYWTRLQARKGFRAALAAQERAAAAQDVDPTPAPLTTPG